LRFFATGRNYDQVRQSIAYPENNVKNCRDALRVSVGPDGATHQALEDMGLMRGLPYMKVIAPADAVETEKTILAIAKMHGPVYVRLTRSPSPVIFGPDYDLRSKGVFLRDGKDVSIVSTGTMTVPAVEAAEILASQGIGATVLHMPTVKPVDVDALLKASETGKIVTIEEHNIINGLGSAVAENLAYYNPTRQKRLGIEDKFGESGAMEELYDKYGLTAPKIAERIKVFMKH
jgi:transketolase